MEEERGVCVHLCSSSTVVVKLYYYMVSMSMVCAHGAGWQLWSCALYVSVWSGLPCTACVEVSCTHVTYIMKYIKYSTKYGAKKEGIQLPLNKAYTTHKNV